MTVPEGLRDRVLQRPAAFERARGWVDAPRRRDRRPILVAIAAVVAAGCVTAVVAVSGQPSRPEAGVACRAAADVDADVVAAAPSLEALAACAEVWEAGELPDVDADPVLGDGTAPPLIACIGQGGLVEVYPYVDACEALGLEAADSQLSPYNQRVVQLQEGVAKLNLEICHGVGAIAQQINDLLFELDLDDWSVSQPTSTPAAPEACAKGDVDASVRDVRIFMI